MCPSAESNKAIATPGRPRGPVLLNRRTMSFKRIAEARQTQIPDKELLTERLYPVYKLRWEELKAILEKRFPNHKFGERRVRGDHYIFEIPEPLNSEDLIKIENARDTETVKKDPSRSESVEPE